MQVGVGSSSGALFFMRLYRHLVRFGIISYNDALNQKPHLLLQKYAKTHLYNNVGLNFFFLGGGGGNALDSPLIGVGGERGREIIEFSNYYYCNIKFSSG